MKLAEEALGRSADDSAAEQMTERFGFLCEDGPGRDPACHIRAKLAFALGRLEYSTAAEVLRVGIRTVQVEAVGGVLFDTGAFLRANCALALAQIRNPDCVRDIALLPFDRSGFAHTPSDPTVKMEPRKAAARALSITVNQAARLPLTLRLVHPENEAPEVLQESMQVLVELEDPHALEVLKPYLHHRDERLSVYAALMIARTRHPVAAGLLGEVIARLSGEPLTASVLTVTTLRTPEAQQLLEELCLHEREAVRLAALEALPPSSASRVILETMALRDLSPRVCTAEKSVLAAN